MKVLELVTRTRVNSWHLQKKEQGIVQEILPDSTQAKFNWGYDPQNFNVPEGSYSTNPSNPASRIIEFKQMVEALHANDIRVVMDVVYNHTYVTEGSNFNNIVPGYYYRSDDAGKFTNGSGTGNEVASERPMLRM